MPLVVSQVSDPSDFQKIMPMDHDAWLTPYNPQLKHFRPNLPTRDERIAYTVAKNAKKLQKNDPNLFFIKVTDTEIDEVIGFAIWAVNQMSDEDDGTAAYWHPEGSEEREFAECFINGLWQFMAERVQRKHLDLHSITVHPSHRHRGVGRMLIRWGTTKADELGIETVISSLNSARGAYERCGFGCIEVIPPNPRLEERLKELEKEGRGQKWKDLLEDDLSGWLMWRPVGRDWMDGDKAPWI
jgi:GNAT superfamily N-acetyltransferase